MSEIFETPYFGVALSVIAFWIGVKLNRKLKTPVCNPLIIAIVLVSAVLLIFRIPYESYNQGGEIINMFLAPATACLAVAVPHPSRSASRNRRAAWCRSRWWR